MGQPVPIREVARPSLVSIYYVQKYWFDGRRLARGAFREHRSEQAARDAGARAAKRNAAVAVMRVRGNPQVDYWRTPEILAFYGDPLLLTRDAP